MGRTPASDDARPAVAPKSSNLLKSLGSRVRAVRVELGLTQEDLGDRAGVAAESISRLEAGRMNLSVVKLEGIAAALGVSVADLLSDAPRPTPAVSPGQRRVLALLDGLDDRQLKQVHLGLKNLLGVSPRKRLARRPTARR
ncbi:MAG: helix-turn-helix domain-containing protein [Polyangiaceae bacterium]|nr:helix-turn-helix domain-containing protein [Polyangiaceae bacterium]